MYIVQDASKWWERELSSSVDLLHDDGIEQITFSCIQYVILLSSKCLSSCEVYGLERSALP